MFWARRVVPDAVRDGFEQVQWLRLRRAAPLRFFPRASPRLFPRLFLQPGRRHAFCGACGAADDAYSVRLAREPERREVGNRMAAARRRLPPAYWSRRQV